MKANFSAFGSHGIHAGTQASNDNHQTPPREPLLLSVCRLSTFTGDRSLSASTGFFFERERRLFLVTSRHVFHDAPSQHFPDRISFGVHGDPVDLTRIAVVDLPLYGNGTALWTQAGDSGGDIDVAALELPPDALPAIVRASAFTLASLCRDPDSVPLGAPVVLACFPLGFYDTTYLLPVARQGSVASPYGIRFQGRGCFVTDARMHRGSSGAPVVMRRPDRHEGGGPWMLLGVHSARMDMGDRDTGQDDMLGLNLAWYADILATLTDDRGRSS
jgi:hypothetical protein